MNAKIPKSIENVEFKDGSTFKSLDEKIEELVQSALTSKLSEIYPIGSMYITTADTNPATLFGGIWAKVADGQALWTASDDAGGSISAGLPNIKGAWSVESGAGAAKTQVFGATKTIISGSGGWSAGYQDTSTGRHLFNAALGECGTSTDSSLPSTFTNNVYGKSTTVQPPAYKVYAWRRTA